MPFNGVGSFTSLGAPTFPAVTGNFILASYFNATLNDVFGGLSSVLCRDGQSGMLANLPMGGFKVVNAAGGTAAGDVLTYNQAAALLQALTVSGAIATGTFSSAADITVGNSVSVGSGGGNVAFNVRMGQNALANNTGPGVGNVALGGGALSGNTSGQFNSAGGVNVLQANTTNSNSTGFGHQALISATGGKNAAFGSGSGSAITTGAGNSILGSFTGNQGGYDIRTSSNNVVLSDGDGNVKLFANASGNVGIGVVPSAWNTFKALQISSTGSIASGDFGGGNVQNVVSNNLRYDGVWRYLTSSTGSSYAQIGNTHYWYGVASGTAGNAATLTNLLAVGLGTTLALEGATSAAGTGIAFPATQLASSNANTLDDYEEGTWTPTQGAGLTVVGTFSSSGTYTKIGRQVTVVFNLSGSTSIAASAGNVACAGLPFASVSPSGLGSIINSSITVAGSCIASSTNILATAISASAIIYGSVTYFV